MRLVTITVYSWAPGVMGICCNESCNASLQNQKEPVFTRANYKYNKTTLKKSLESTEKPNLAQQVQTVVSALFSFHEFRLQKPNHI